MTDVLYPDLSGNGKGVLDLDDIPNSSVEFTTMLGLVFTDIGGVADAVELTGLSISSGSNVLTSSTSQFSGADVGKKIVVADAGGTLPAGLSVGGVDRLIATITGYTSTTQVTLSLNAVTTANNKRGVKGTDNGPILDAAFATLTSAKGGTLFIDNGHFLFTSGASQDFGSSITPAVNIIGCGSDTVVYVAVPYTTDLLFAQSVQMNISDITFYGLEEATVDCRNVFSFNGAVATVTRCRFSAIFSALHMIYSTGLGVLRMKECNTGGCFVPSNGSAQVYGLVEMDNWRAFSDENSEFIDYGIVNGRTISKASFSGTEAWIRLNTPSSEVGARRHKVPRFVGTIFDEGSNSLVRIDPASGTVDGAEFISCRHNISGSESGRGMWLENVVDVKVRNCTFGWADNSRPLGYFENCTVLLDNITLSASVNAIQCVNTTLKIIKKPSALTAFDMTNSRLLLVDPQYDGYAVVKYGAISDADFVIPPAVGTKGFDRLNKRRYEKWLKTEGWIYFNTDGGSTTGPELVTNGTFTTNTTGWTAGNSATLSSTSGKLRVTNTAASGRAYQSIPVEIGQVHRLSIDCKGGTAGFYVDLGNSPSAPDYTRLDTTVADGRTYVFTPTASTVYVTMVVNHAGSGFYAEWDNVSIVAI